VENEQMRPSSDEVLAPANRITAAPAVFRPATADAPAAAASGPVSQHVYQTLRQLLITGGFRPGEGVSLRTLAKRLGTSAMPVREAVNRLIAEQALQMLPNRQVIVPHMTRRKFFELTRVRQLLEGMAAGDACDSMTDALLARLEADHKEMLAALDTETIAEILTRNKEFHFTLYRAAQPEVLLPMIEGLWMQTGPFQALSLSRQKALWRGHRHTALLTALRERERQSVVAEIQGDINDVAEMLMQIGGFDE
jgi:DNA-binding GntR family transcriptional regulator